MRIVTDCAADMPPEEVKSLGVTVAPLFIQFPEGETDASDLTPDEFYDRLEAMVPEIPTTAQPSAGMFAELYRELVAEGEEVMSIHLSSGLSGTVQSARLGARELPDADITVVDAMTLAGGLRYQVIVAVLAAKAGWDKSAILKRLEEVRAATEVVYTLETLEYLARGGRIGRVQALAGVLFKIKPVIRVDHADGKYSTVAKARTMRKAQAMIVDHLAEMYGADRPLWLVVQHGRLPDEAERFAEALRSRLNVERYDLLRVSPILGVHTGPGIVGAGILPMDLLEGLE